MLSGTVRIVGDRSCEASKPTGERQVLTSRFLNVFDAFVYRLPWIPHRRATVRKTVYISNMDVHATALHFKYESEFVSHCGQQHIVSTGVSVPHSRTDD